jgi:hypothetical protein
VARAICANLFTHCKHKKARPIAEVHLGFWVFIRRAVRISAFISSAARSCLGISLLQVSGHPQVVRPCDLEVAHAISLRSAASGRLSAPGFFSRLNDMRRFDLVAALHPPHRRPFSVLMRLTPGSSQHVRGEQG